MEVLFILLYFQLSGIIISFVLVYNDRIVHKKYISTTTRKLIFANRTNIAWMTEYLQDHPKKVFRRYFPELYNVAIATKRYKELNFLKRKGFYNEKEYDRKLARILPLIDITSDLKIISEQTMPRQ